MQVDSNEQKLDPKQIIKSFAETHEKRYPPNITINAITAELKSGKTKLMQQGNTVFLVSPAKNKTAVFRALNADTAENYVANTIIFVQAMNELGYEYLMTEFTDPAILNVLKAAFKNPVPRKAKAAYKVYKLPEGGYQAIIKTGERRGG